MNANLSRVPCDKLKREYWKRAMALHPNKGGNTEMFQNLGASYERAQRRCENSARQTARSNVRQPAWAEAAPMPARTPPQRRPFVPVNSNTPKRKTPPAYPWENGKPVRRTTPAGPGYGNRTRSKSFFGKPERPPVGTYTPKRTVSLADLPGYSFGGGLFGRRR